jgi:hypothetical protein
MMLKFIPPMVNVLDKGITVPRYASYVVGEYRHRMKVHSRLGDAKLSIYNRAVNYSSGEYRESYILELVDGVWYVLYEVPAGTLHEDLPWLYDHVTIRFEEINFTAEELAARRPWDTRTTKRVTVRDVSRKSRPMTKDEYANWRVRVAIEAMANGF